MKRSTVTGMLTTRDRLIPPRWTFYHQAGRISLPRLSRNSVISGLDFFSTASNHRRQAPGRRCPRCLAPRPCFAPEIRVKGAWCREMTAIDQIETEFPRASGSTVTDLIFGRHQDRKTNLGWYQWFKSGLFTQILAGNFMCFLGHFRGASWSERLFEQGLKSCLTLPSSRLDLRHDLAQVHYLMPFFNTNFTGLPLPVDGSWAREHRYIGSDDILNTLAGFHFSRAKLLGQRCRRNEYADSGLR